MPEKTFFSLSSIGDRIKDGLQGIPEDGKAAFETTHREILTTAIKKKILLGDFELIQPNGKKVTVGEVLDNPDRWHGKRFADPLEPDYGD